MNAHRLLFTRSVIFPASLAIAACSSPSASMDSSATNDPGVAIATQEEGTGIHTSAITEAPTGFDSTTNGFVDQATMDAARAKFETAETFADGIGPCFNNISCVSCHGTPFPATGAG